MPSRLLAALALTGALALGISACGSSSSSGSTNAAATSGGAGTSSSTARYQARLNLAKCFRAHGINVPDPTQGGGPAGGGGAFRVLRQYSQTQVQAATTACSQYLKQAFAFANVSPAQAAQFRQQFVKYAECMRSHGVDVPDPSTTTGGGFGLRGVITPAVRNSPAFQTANTACQSLRPRFGRGGQGGPGGGPPGG